MERSYCDKLRFLIGGDGPKQGGEQMLFEALYLEAEEHLPPRTRRLIDDRYAEARARAAARAPKSAAVVLAALLAALPACDDDPPLPAQTEKTIDLSGAEGLQGCSIRLVNYSLPPKNYRREITVVKCAGADVTTATYRTGKHDEVVVSVQPAVPAPAPAPPAPATPNSCGCGGSSGSAQALPMDAAPGGRTRCRH